jgi:Na+/phosphate symporter
LTELYDAGVDTVTRRVAALRVYLSRVQVLSITIDNIAQVDKLIAVSDAASVVGDIVKGQTAIESVSDMNKSLEILRKRMSGELDSIHTYVLDNRLRLVS